MTVVRGVIGGVVFGAVSWLLGGLVYGVLFNKWVMLTPSLWRPMDSMLMTYGMPLVDLLSGLLISLLFAIFYKSIPGRGLAKGLSFGFLLWLVTRFSGELFMYTLMPYHYMLVFAGWLHGICAMPLGGLVLAAIYGKSLED